MTDDELDRLLAPPTTSSSPSLRDRLREETTRRVRHPRWVTGLVLVASMAACYLGGGLTVWLKWPPPRIEVRTIEIPVAAPAGTGPAVPPREYRSPRDLELAAEQADGAASAKLYLEAGRRYGREWNDWPSAMRCYRNALDLVGGAVEVDATNDDWLLVKLKSERRETHANP